METRYGFIANGHGIQSTDNLKFHRSTVEDFDQEESGDGDRDIYVWDNEATDTQIADSDFADDTIFPVLEYSEGAAQTVRAGFNAFQTAVESAVLDINAFTGDPDFIKGFEGARKMLLNHFLKNR